MIAHFFSLPTLTTLTTLTIFTTLKGSLLLERASCLFPVPCSLALQVVRYGADYPNPGRRLKIRSFPPLTHPTQLNSKF
ncbi:hypothetical protein [Moorena sp. SIO3I6]|uniref:hypothetical protein n=1 Tax=Moorena sp. SIO3I6 TaxID=2607831 RepID=UPI0025D122C8|nr:hypothetical protein [Moorena sp. SIO3I6]